MDEQRPFAGPQFRAERSAEYESVRATIVGGRPPGSGQAVGPIPRGIEALVRKASVDEAFRDLLLAHRTEAAESIGLELSAAEAMVLRAVPDEQLRAIIANTHVPHEHRRAFLGQAAAAMLAAMSAMPTASAGAFIGAGGIRPPDPAERAREETRDKVRKSIARYFQRNATSIENGMKLVDDLKSTPRQLIGLRRQLEREFKIELPQKTFQDFQTVGHIADHVAKAVEANGKKADGQSPVPPKSAPNAGLGNRPDGLAPGAAGGARPK